MEQQASQAPMKIDLNSANLMIAEGRRIARGRKLRPLTFCVLDQNGHIITAQSESGAALLHFDMAFAKAWGCVGLGHSSRYYKDVMLSQSPLLAGGLEMLSRGRVLAEYGGVLVRDAEGRLLGAIGIAGDRDTNDEAVALEVIKAGGFQADLG